MRSFLSSLALAAALVACAARPPQNDAALYNDLGGMPGIQRVIGDMIDRSVVDPRIAWSFDNTNHDRLKRLISQQVCNLSGGPCARRERGMGPAHRHLGLRESHFNAVVEHLQDSMDAAGTPFRAQLRLLRLLAPMKREIVAG